jgi:hypothetical protein
MILKILISTASLVFFVVFTISNAFAQGGTWNVYENASLGFKISYPSDWVYVETNEQLDRLSRLSGVIFTPATEINIPKGSNEPEIIFYVLELSTPIRNLPLSFFMNNLQNMFMNITGTTFGSNETIELKNNVSAFSVNLTSNTDNSEKRGSLMTISKSPDVFFAGYAASPINWFKYHTIIQNMINSLEFVP